MVSDINWSSVYENGGDFRVLTPSELTDIFQHLPKGSLARSALDIGCGTGQLTRDLWFRGCSVKGVDPALKAIEIAQDASSRISDDSLVYVASDISGVTSTERYDLIFCKLVFAFIEDKENFLDTLKSHMYPHSSFIMISPVLGSKISKTKPFICVDHDLALEQLKKKFDVVYTY